MSHAVFLHAAGDARVAPFNLREGAPGETLIDVAASGSAAATCTITRMAASARP